jgi:hypothetical protein
VGCDVMHAMVNARHDDVHVLQDCDIEGQSSVGVWPFVYLFKKTFYKIRVLTYLRRKLNMCS